MNQPKNSFGFLYLSNPARNSRQLTNLGVSPIESYICSNQSPHPTQSKRLAPKIPGGGGRGVLALLAILALAPVLPAQSSVRPTATIPALFLSDVHLDPFHDPAKVAKLNAAPAADWPAILAQPDSPTQPADDAALQRLCLVRGADTTNALWLSSLQAIHANAAHTRFATLSGDLLAHKFDCKYQALLPSATHADYLAFVENTVRYVVTSLRQSLPGVPLYIALGNNDSGCTDYALDPTHDQFLAATAKVIAEALPADLSHADREAALHDFAASGSYSVPLAGIPHTRLIVLDDIFLSASYQTCSGNSDPAPAAAQLGWLRSQLNSARQRGERVWFMSHIPTGVNLYATARARLNVCAGVAPQMYLSSESLAQVLAANADIVRLALFGHTHSDEMHLLTAGAPHLDSEMWEKGVPVKTVASITPVNGNRPSFTLASIDPVTANLADYTVIMASNSTGVATAWSPEYTYSSTYREPSFDAASVASLITGFQTDPAAKAATSQAYLRSYSPGDISPILTLAWPQYACSMTRDSAAAFTTCACAKLGAP